LHQIIKSGEVGKDNPVADVLCTIHAKITVIR